MRPAAEYVSDFAASALDSKNDISKVPTTRPVVKSRLEVTRFDRETGGWFLFMQLNEGESDLMASFEEVDPIVKYVEPLTDTSGNITQTPDERAL